MKNHRGRSPLELKTDFRNSCFIPFLLLEDDEDSRKDRICVGRGFFFSDTWNCSNWSKNFREIRFFSFFFFFENERLRAFKFREIGELREI